MTQNVKKRKLLVIGWDAADWKVINPLLKQGKMPALEKLIKNGVSGNIKTLEPPFSPMLWTTIATGVRPDKHGILGFVEPDPLTGSVRPVSSTSRKVKAIWNILMQNGYVCNTIGWWPSHPAEPLNGVCVSNMYQRANKRIFEDWPLTDNSIYPKNLEPIFKALRVHPDELTEQHILPFIPNAAKIDQTKDKRLDSFLKVLADSSTIQSAGTWALDHTEWDFTAIYFDGIDHFCHGFMKFHPPKIHDSLPDELFEMYKDVINGAYIFHDMMLEHQMELAGEDATIMLLSDHGFHSDHLRPLHLPKEEPAAPALEHRPYGIFCISGPDIKKNETIGGVTLLDICPTILSLFDLPIGEDMEGKPLMQIYEKQFEIKKIKTWEDVEGECGMHSKDLQEDPYAAQEALKQLIDLGYIEDVGEDKEKAVERVKMHAQYNLARVYLGSNRAELAEDILLKIVKDNPENSRFLLRLASCYQQLNKLDECKEVIKQIKLLERKKKIDARDNFKKKLENAVKEGKVDVQKLEEFNNKNSQINDSPTLDLLEGNILLADNKPKKALELFKKAELSTSDQPKLYSQIGKSYLLLKKWNEAEKAYKTALQIDKENPSILHGIGLVYLKQNKIEESIDSLLSAISLNYHYPFAHYHLGEALYKLKEFESAAHAFEVCLSMAPNISKARNYLIDIYENKLKTPEKIGNRFKDQILPPTQKINISSKQDYNIDSLQLEDKISEQKKLLDEVSKGTIIIVSGLPRSGTSMMMQMLHKGGMEVYVDEQRQADENNPKGYYEHENVKKLINNKLWLKEVGDKVVKIVSPLLIHLPPRYKYKVVFMTRNIQDVVISQNKMLVKLGKSKPDTYPLGLEDQFKKNLERVKMWVEKNYNVEICYIDYAKTIENPTESIIKLKEFLQVHLNETEMKKVVDASLYHNK